MTTAKDVVTEAFFLSGVTGEGKRLSSEKSNRGLVLLNDLLNEWGIHNTLNGGGYWNAEDTLTFNVEHLRGIKYNLAVEIINFYRAPMNPMVLQTANDTKSLMITDTVELDSLEMPPGMPGIVRAY